MIFSIKTLIGSAMLFGMAVQADTVIKCFSCGKAPAGDCYNAYAMVPTSGEASGNDNSVSHSGKCQMGYYPDGYAAQWPTVHGAAQSLINKCCAGYDSCAGVAYDTGSTNGLEDGCVCMGAGACSCGGGTPSSVCI